MGGDGLKKMVQFFGLVFLITVFTALLLIPTRADNDLIGTVCAKTTDKNFCTTNLYRQWNLKRSVVERNLNGLLYISCDYCKNITQETSLQINEIMRVVGNPVAKMVLELCKNKYQEAENSFFKAVELTANRKIGHAMANVRDGKNKVDECDNVQNSTLLFRSHRDIAKFVEILRKFMSPSHGTNFALSSPIASFI